MSYRVRQIFSDSPTTEEINLVTSFCAESATDSKQVAAQNMAVENWEDNPASLLYLLLIEKRFSQGRGGLFLLFDEDKVVAISGYYQSDFDSATYVMGVRSWVLKEHRHHLLISDYLLPQQLKECQGLGARNIILTFNTHTKPFAHLIERGNKNPDQKTKFFFGDKFPEVYEGMVFYKHPVKIKNSKQWIMIKSLAPHDFDWSLIHWPEEGSHQTKP